MKWDEAAVESAIRSLPMRDDGKMPDVSEMVTLIRLGAWSGQGNTRSRARSATQKQTMAELRKLCDLCRELYEHIEAKMHSPALRMVEEQIRTGRAMREAKGERPLHHPLLLTVQVEGTFAAARAAWLDAKNGGDLPQPTNRGTKPAARDVTSRCANVFESVTGRPPARNYDAYTGQEGGAFLDFLGRIFDAVGLKAKPAGQAKLLLEKRAAKKA